MSVTVGLPACPLYPRRRLTVLSVCVYYRWLRDNLGLISEFSEVETLSREVADTGGVYFVPAFTGLYAPHWDSTARG